jgi:hypothetical protein
MVKVLPVHLAFPSICDLLKDGMPFCGKVATKNKDMFAFYFLFLLGCKQDFLCILVTLFST